MKSYECILMCDRIATKMGIPFLDVNASPKFEKGTHKHSLLYGNCISDMSVVDAHGNVRKSFQIYAGVAQRCFDPKIKSKFPAYKDCTLSVDWHIYSIFDRWFGKNYVEGFHLDKDILVPGNKIYGPRYCRFVPPAINQLITTKCKVQNGLPRGIYYDKSRNKIVADFFGDGKRIRLGRFDVDDVDSALAAYKEVKAEHIVAMSERYKAVMCSEIYETLIYRARNGIF